jgi:hypothetical protein
MSRWWTCLALLALGCSKPRTDGAPATSSPSSAGSAQATSSPSSAGSAQALTRSEPETKVGDESPATEADFEGEAEGKITAQNLEAELDQLEKELDKVPTKTD